MSIPIDTTSIHQDPLTGLGDHSKLISDLTAALVPGQSPTVLAVFEIVGSRDHRRAFGERANDELIVRCAEKFKSLIEPDGVCYRPRRDEFCALIPGRIEDVSATLFEVEAELRSDEEFSLVTACFGAAALPDEADDPTGLLMIADQRISMRIRGRELRERRHDTTRLTEPHLFESAERPSTDSQEPSLPPRS